MKLPIAMLLAAACMLSAGPAQSFPTRTVKIVVGLTPGSASDAVARYLASALPALLGQPSVVDNRPGGNGIIAVQAVMNAPADGHTLYMATNSPMSANPVLIRNLPYRPERDLVPVSGAFRTANVFVVPKESPLKSLADLVALGQRGARAVDVATYTPAYWLVAAWFAQEAGIRFNNIPYKGMAPALSDLVGNHVGLAFVDQSGVGALLSDGKLRALAVTGSAREKRFPQVPTVREAGYGAFVHYSWGSIYVHARTPQSRIEKLTAAVAKALSTPEAHAFMEQQGLEPHVLPPADMRKFHLDQLHRYRQIAAQAGIEPQ